VHLHLGVAAGSKVDLSQGFQLPVFGHQAVVPRTAGIDGFRNTTIILNIPQSSRLSYLTLRLGEVTVIIFNEHEDFILNVHILIAT
jgi:hypothetical protein